LGFQHGTLQPSHSSYVYILYIHEPGQKSWWEGRGEGKFLGGGRVKKILKFFLQIFNNPERFQIFSEKMAFYSQKSQKFLQKCHFRWEEGSL
jgi:hypothetical protein